MQQAIDRESDSTQMDGPAPLRGSRSHPEPQQPITFRGETKTLAQWAFLSRRTPASLWRSIKTNGLESALTDIAASTIASAKHASNSSPWRRGRMVPLTSAAYSAR